MWRIPRTAKSVVAIAGIAAAGLWAADGYLTRDLTLPPYQAVVIHRTAQNWQPEDWNWFHHASQGTALELVIPYKWFLALEQPRISLGELPRLSDPAYIQRFGFLPSEKDENNPDGLPVGFARTPEYRNPVSGKTEDVIGFTCAACHTGQVNYQGKGVRIEGGPAMINMAKFRAAAGVSVLITRYDSFRYDRFAKRVLGDNASPEAREQLKRDLIALFDEGEKLRERNKRLKLYPVEEGFARLDALGRIGNFVFGTELGESNLLPADAPVNFPPIWNAPWFEWVQYNGSIKQAMTRNAGEAMGVFARVDLRADSGTLFESTIAVRTLYEIETRLRGPNVFQPGEKPRFRGLDAPKWPEEILGKIDRAGKAEKGRALYVKNCQACHLPAPDTAEFFDAKHWTEPDRYGNKYLKLRLLDVYDIGTDPAAAMNWYKAVVNLGQLGQRLKGDINKRLDSYLGKGAGGSYTPVGVALPLLVEKTVEKRYQRLGIPPNKWDEMNGNRANEVRAPLAYKARPLNGVWATAPYLHNGSVPTIYQMLLPVEKRDKTFYLGSREYDPVHLGYQTKPIEGGFLLDTRQLGNRNTGHQFRGSQESWRATEASGVFTGGVIGPELTDDERMALIEYLKTL